MNSDNQLREEYVNARSEMTRYLNRIHLLLVGTCFIFFIASFLSPSAVIERAFDQVRVVLLIDQKLNNGWFRNEVNIVLKNLTTESRSVAKSPIKLLGTRNIIFNLNGKPKFGLRLKESVYGITQFEFINKISDRFEVTDVLHSELPIFFIMGKYSVPRLAHGSPRNVLQFHEEWELLRKAKAYTLKLIGTYITKLFRLDYCIVLEA